MNRTDTTHILIAEDNPGDIRLIRLALEETPDWKVTVTIARDGAQAIDVLESIREDAENPQGERLDLVILDFNLPKRSGTEVLKTIRHSEHLHKLPVVVLSSSPEYFLRERMRDAKVEATCYLTKPSDFEEFVRIGGHIRECYRAGLAAGPPSPPNPLS